MAQELPPTVWGGKTEIGHLTYTEIRFWAEKTRATPDGRHDGEYFSQGLTPSRLHKIGSVFEVLDSFSALDPSKMAGRGALPQFLRIISGHLYTYRLIDESTKNIHPWQIDSAMDGCFCYESCCRIFTRYSAGVMPYASRNAW